MNQFTTSVRYFVFSYDYEREVVLLAPKRYGPYDEFDDEKYLFDLRGYDTQEDAANAIAICGMSGRFAVLPLYVVERSVNS